MEIIKVAKPSLNLPEYVFYAIRPYLVYERKWRGKPVQVFWDSQKNPQIVVGGKSQDIPKLARELKSWRISQAHMLGVLVQNQVALYDWLTIEGVGVHDWPLEERRKFLDQIEKRYDCENAFVTEAHPVTQQQWCLWPAPSNRADPQVSFPW